MPAATARVVERQAPVDLLQAAGLVGVADLAALGVAVELAVRARDLDPALVLLEGAEREVEDAERERLEPSAAPARPPRSARLGSAEPAFRPARYSGEPPRSTQISTGWGPRIATRGCARWADFGGRRNRASRMVRRSANGPSPGRATNSVARGDNEPVPLGIAASACFRSPVNGHQNSSASLWITQSAPISPGDPRDLLLAALLHVVDSTPDALEPHDSGALVRLEDLDGAVGGPGVGDDEEVDSLRAVITQVVLDDVRLVADLERHCEPHGAGG